MAGQWAAEFKFLSVQPNKDDEGKNNGITGICAGQSKGCARLARACGAFKITSAYLIHSSSSTDPHHNV